MCPNDRINIWRYVIYIHLKNDVSFILDEWQNLFEQQSSFNPNQPLRGFFYFADLYKTKYLFQQRTGQPDIEVVAHLD